MAEAADERDPPPAPPIEPKAGDCCGGGCVPCVFEIYENELARYEEALERWRTRDAGGGDPKEAK